MRWPLKQGGHAEALLELEELTARESSLRMTYSSAHSEKVVSHVASSWRERPSSDATSSSLHRRRAVSALTLPRLSGMTSPVASSTLSGEHLTPVVFVSRCCLPFSP